MTQDNDDLLAQVFSVIPSLDHNNLEHHEHHEINGNTIKDDNMQEIAANVRRVSNAFQDFLDKSGVVETHFESVTENHHSESHFQVMTTHVETHHEVVTNHHEEHHIGGGVTIEHHTIGNGATVQEDHHSIGHGVSLIATEQLPSVIENHESSIGHGAEVTTEYHIGQGAAIVHEEHNGIGHGAVPHDAVQNYAPLVDDQESVISAHTAFSEATSVSVHSSVSQKSVQLYADAPVQLPSAHQSVISHHSASTVKESRHSDITHTHDKESTISLTSVQSKDSEKTLTGSHASGESKGTTVNNYVFVEKTDVIEAASEISTPVAPLKSAPHDALIEEFKQLHPRQPSEVSIPPPPTSSPPPLDDEETASEVVMTVRVTEFEFDSNHVKNSMTVEHKESHHHSEEEHHEEHFHAVDHHNVEHDSHVAIGEGAQINHDHVIGEGVQLKGVHHLDSEDEFKFEEVEYVHEGNTHHVVGNVVEKAASVVSSVVAKSDPPPVFFQSPVLHRRVPSNVASHVDSSSDDETIHGSQHGAGYHHHHHHHEHHEHDLHRDLVPNVSGPYVRDEPRPVHVAEEYRTTTTVVKTVAPIAHVSPVISQEKGVPKIDHREHLTPMVEATPIVHKVVEETHTHHEDHHSHHHEHHEHHHHHESVEKDYHKHDEQLEEVFSGPSVRDLKSKFEQGGKVEIHYTTHYISHQNQPRQNHEEVHLHHVEHEHHTHEHEHALHEHNHHEHQHEQHIHHEHSHHEHHDVSQHDNSAIPHLPHRETHNHVDILHEHEVEHQQQHHHHHESEHKHRHHHHHHETEHKHHHHHHHHHHEKARADSHHHHHHHHEHEQHQHQVQQVQQEVHVHEENHQHEHVHVHHHEDHVHQHHEVEHHQTEIEQAVEEEQLPVSFLLSKYGGGAKLRRPDHVEEIKIYSRKSTLHNIGDGAAPVVQQVVEPQMKSRTVTQSSVSTKQTRSESTFSVQSSQQRSHASTLTQNHEAVQQVAVTPIVAAAPVAAARSTSSDHQSVRVVKSVRAFVNQWGQKDFKPPTSPVITVPRLPSSPRSQEKEFFPEAISRKSTVTSQVNNVVAQEHHDYNANEKIERAQSVAYSEAHSVRSEARSIAASQATSVSKSCENCSICGKNVAAQSKASSKRPSVASEASTVTTTTYSVHKTPAAFVEETIHIENTGYANQPIPEVHEEFVLTPLAERRALFEHGVNRGYSIRRNLHGELRPMVNVFTD